MNCSLSQSPKVEFTMRMPKSLSSLQVRRREKSGYRRILTFVALCIAVFMIFTVTRGFAVNQNQKSAISTKMVAYIVQPGDTLWGIAKQNQPNQNLYHVLAIIEQYNQVNDNENIYPGQELWIPAN